MNTQPYATRTLYIVVILAMVLSLPWLGRPFHTRGEPREALVAQAMLATGNWISPVAYDGAVPSKPPFSHWLIALVSLPIGEVTETTSRLPSALFFVVFAAAFFLFIARRLDVQAGFGATLVLLSSSEWFRGASTCRVDTILACSMAGALLALYAWWERGFRGVPYLAAMLIVCAALTKGPVGIVLPLGIFSFFCWSKRDFEMAAIPPILIRALILCVVATSAASIWYFLAYAQRGDEFLNKIWYENVERFTSTMKDEPHKHGVGYLIGMLAIGLLPWTIPVVMLGFQELRHKKMFKSIASGTWWSGLPDLLKLSTIAACFITLFFCCFSSKRSVYLLPAYPFLAILIAGYLHSKLEGFYRWVTLVIVSVAGLAAMFAVFTSLIPSFPYHSVWFSWAGHIFSPSFLSMIVSSVVLLITLFCLGTRDALKTPMHALGAAVIGAVWAGSLFVYDAVAHRLSVKAWLASAEFRAAVRPDQRERFYSYGSEAYAASFYLRKPFFGASSALEAGSVIFVEQRNIEDLKKFVAYPVREISRYSSGLEKSSRDLVVVEIEKPSSETHDRPVA